jgi:high-affinity nickel-transport protein
MTSALVILAIGFFLGMRHATDPDHVVAVSTIVSREKSIPRAGWIGVLWGVGHTITILVVGAAIILFGFVIPPRLGLALEFSVALMLILLGVLNLTGAMKWISHKLSPTHPDLCSSRAEEHSHLHFHGGKIHVHPHSHQGSTQHHAKEVDPPHWLAEPFVKLGWFHSLRPLLVGIVHGLAGSAAVALLVLGTIHDARWAIFYLLLFGIGTIIGMMLITLAFAVPVTVAGNRFAWVSRTMVTGTGVLSLVFGLVVAYQIGIADGLFSPHPSWTPH